MRGKARHVAEKAAFRPKRLNPRVLPALGIGMLAALLGTAFYLWPDHSRRDARDEHSVAAVAATLPAADQEAAVPPAPPGAPVLGGIQDAAASREHCQDELAALENSSALLRQRRAVAIAKFRRQSGLTGLARELAVDLAGQRAESKPDDVYRRNHPQSTSPPLARQRRQMLVQLLESVGLGGLLGYGLWVSEDRAPELTFGEREMAEAIKHGVPLEVLRKLGDWSGLFPGATMTSGVNLANAAAIYGRPTLLRWLIGQGAAPFGGGAVLDDIALLPVAKDDSRYAAVATQLLELGARPHMPSTLGWLAERLPNAKPALHPDARAILERPEIERVAEGLRSLVADWNARIAAAESVERRCLAAASNMPADDRPAALLSSLASKQRHEDAAREALENDPLWREFEEISARTEAMMGTGDVPEATRAYGQMRSLWRAGRYHAAFATAEEWGLDYETLVELSLRRGAPLPAVLIAVERNGGRLPANAILLLAEKPWPGAAELARVLFERYGFDPHVVDRDGRNAHDLLSTRFYNLQGPTGVGALNPDSRALARFLAEQAVTVKPRPLGFDPLDNVLRAGLRTTLAWPAVVDHCRFLLDHGAPVERSHLELAALIAERYPARYRQLADAAPELARAKGH